MQKRSQQLTTIAFVSVSFYAHQNKSIKNIFLLFKKYELLGESLEHNIHICKIPNT